MQALAWVQSEWEGEHHSCRLDETWGDFQNNFDTTWGSVLVSFDAKRKIDASKKIQLKYHRPAWPLLTPVSLRKTSAGRESRLTRLGRWWLVRSRTFQRTATVDSTTLWPGAGSSTSCSGSSSWWLMPPGLPALMMMLQEGRSIRLYNWWILGKPC